MFSEIFRWQARIFIKTALYSDLLLQEEFQRGETSKNMSEKNKMNLSREIGTTNRLRGYFEFRGGKFK